MKGVRTALFVLLTLAVMGGALAYSFHKTGTEDLAQALRNAQWGFAPLAVLLGLLVYPIKALRWRVILGRRFHVSYRTLLSAIMIGFMANCLISRLGELIRAGVMGLKAEMSVPAALASIALERIFDTCTVVLFLAIALLWLRPTAGGEGAAHLAAVRTTGSVAVVLLVAAVGFLVLVKLRPRWTTRAVARLVAWLPRSFRLRAENLSANFLQGLDSVSTWGQLLAILLLSIIHWGLQVLFFLFAAYCFPGMAMGMAGALLVFAVVAFGVAGGPLPGYLGIYQFSVLAAGKIMGMNETTGPLWIYYSWLSWALNIPFVIAVGFLFLWTEGLTLRQIREGSPAGREMR